MATKTPRRKESWWKTFPGVLTALAGLITALAGLIAVLKKSPADAPSNAGEPPAAAHAMSGENPPPARNPALSPARPEKAPPATPVSPGPRMVSLPAGPEAEANFGGQKVVVRLLSARVEPTNAENSRLVLTVRMSNQGSAGARNYYWKYRLVVDGVLREPIAEPVYDEVAPQSAKEWVYTFEIPAATARVVFRVLRDDEAHDFPLELRGYPNNPDNRSGAPSR